MKSERIVKFNTARYHLVDYQAWRKAKKEKGYKLPDICHSGCVYEMVGSDTGAKS